MAPLVSGAHFYGCTVVANSDNTSGLPNGEAPQYAWTNTSGEGGGTTTWENCAFFGFRGVYEYESGLPGTSGATYSSCMTDVTICGRAANSG